MAEAPVHPAAARRPWLGRLLAAAWTATVLGGGVVAAWLGADAALGMLGSWTERGGLHARALLLGPVRVGIQIGHLHAHDHPEEHAHLRVSTGGAAHGWTEVEINEAVATELAERLRPHGIEVDLLPARVPPRYRADLLVSLHADSSPDPLRRGYKSAHFEPARTPYERVLKSLVDRSYLAATGLPDDHDNVSGNMLQYYAFDPAFRHAVSPVTPSVLVEMGYISNRSDLELLAQPELPAAAIAEAIVAYLRQVGRLPAS